MYGLLSLSQILADTYCRHASGRPFVRLYATFNTIRVIGMYIKLHIQVDHDQSLTELKFDLSLTYIYAI